MIERVLLYQEKAQFPFEIIFKTRIISFMSNLISGKESKLSFQLYKILKPAQNLDSKWINNFKIFYVALKDMICG